MTQQSAPIPGLALAIKFQDTYERLAPSFGYETRPGTFDPESKYGKLMVAVCAELLSQSKELVCPDSFENQRVVGGWRLDDPSELTKVWKSRLPPAVL